MMLNTLKYYFKNTIGYLFKICGGIYLIKYILKKKPYYMVFNYHNFSKYNNYKIKRGPILETGYSDNFEKQILFLKKHFTFLYPTEFFEGRAQNGLNILITFDDGYKDNYDLAFPVLKKHQAKSIFFVVTDYIDTNKWLLHDKARYLVSINKLEKFDTEKKLKEMNQGNELSISFKYKVNNIFDNEIQPIMMMSWEEVIKLNTSGFLIGAHTVSHKILSFLNLNDQKFEIEESILKLNNKIGEKTNMFAYPNGLFNKHSLELMKNNKVEYAFTTNPGINLQSQNKLKIKRIGINASDSITIVLLKMILNCK